MDTTPTITGFRHLALTVSDLDRSVAWYRDVLGFEQLVQECSSDRSAVVLHIPASGVVVGLVRFTAGSGDEFTPHRTGLDHLCFAVANRDELKDWMSRLDEHGVAHSGIGEMATGPILNFKDPDGIALAFSLRPPIAT